MDLHLLDAEPTAEEREAVDALLGEPRSGWEGGARDESRDAFTAAGGHEVRALRHLLLPALQAVQARVGWVSEGGLNYVCQRLSVPPADAYGVATFYALLSTVPRPACMVHVCDDIACRCKGAAELCAELERTVGPAYHAPHDDHVDLDAAPSGWLRSPCLGLCEQAPAAMVTVAGPKPVERLFGHADVAGLSRILKGDLAPSLEPRLRLWQAGDPYLRLLRRVDVTDPTSLDAYRCPRRLRGAAPRVSVSARRASSARSATPSSWAGAGGCVAHRAEVGGGRPPAGPAPLPDLQCGRVRAGHLQGPGHRGGRSFAWSSP